MSSKGKTLRESSVSLTHCKSVVNIPNEHTRKALEDSDKGIGF